MIKLLKRYEAIRPFTDVEAWILFRLAAFGEAIGWTLLIMGILLERYIPAINGTAVAIAGRIHGTLFIAYLAACIVLYPSLRWSPWRALIALILSVPPYGTLLFEQWEAHRRSKHGFRSFRHYIAYVKLTTSELEVDRLP